MFSVLPPQAKKEHAELRERSQGLNITDLKHVNYWPTMLSLLVVFLIEVWTDQL